VEPIWLSGALFLFISEYEPALQGGVASGLIGALGQGVIRLAAYSCRQRARLPQFQLLGGSVGIQDFGQ
jgi:hypothetical protein